MVTSQGQVVTQAIPQGAIQIQNTQVSVRAQVCAHVHGMGRATVTVYYPPGPLHQRLLQSSLSLPPVYISEAECQEVLGFPHLSGYVKGSYTSHFWPLPQDTPQLSGIQRCTQVGGERGSEVRPEM